MLPSGFMRAKVTGMENPKCLMDNIKVKFCPIFCPTFRTGPWSTQVKLQHMFNIYDWIFICLTYNFTSVLERKFHIIVFLISTVLHTKISVFIYPSPKLCVSPTES